MTEPQPSPERETLSPALRSELSGQAQGLTDAVVSLEAGVYDSFYLSAEFVSCAMRGDSNRPG